VHYPLQSVRQVKVDRLRPGVPPRTLDLFCGCGGISLGFQRAGFSIVGAVDSDEFASRSHARTFHRETYVTHSEPRDLTRIEPDELIRSLGFTEPTELAVDVVVGGPPCQAFARVGRAKLREVDEHPDAFRLDPRGNLYLRYLHYVRTLRPVAVLMENVPDVLNYGGHNIAEEMCEVLEQEGYSCRYTLLNAAFYGVPQMRERMFLIGLAKELNREVRFPPPTHWAVLPRGYESSRRVALQAVERTLFDQGGRYMPPPPPSSSLPTAITAHDALHDLPKITAHLEGKMPRGPRRVDEPVDYRPDVTPSSYAQLMRNWPGYETRLGPVTGHVIRSLPRDYKIFARLSPGDQYPEAHRLACLMFEERLAQLRGEGHCVEAGTCAYRQLKAGYVPPYDPGKFPNKWRKMEADRPARTLMAHLGKDGYSHIHYDHDQARTISVREAARLQSFPDGFQFEGSMNPAFRQVGNAVPPLMAYALATEIRAALGAHDGGELVPAAVSSFARKSGAAAPATLSGITPAALEHSLHNF
jgi:DNA (cytosine-5)-methyltransferase 1